MLLNDPAFVGMGVLPLSAVEIVESLPRRVASAASMSCPRAPSSLLRQITRAPITAYATTTTPEMTESAMSQFIGASFRITHQLSGLSTCKSTGGWRYPHGVPATGGPLPAEDLDLQCHLADREPLAAGAPRLLACTLRRLRSSGAIAVTATPAASARCR